MIGDSGNVGQSEDVAPKKSQRKSRATSKSVAPASQNSNTSAVPPRSRRTTRSTSRKASVEPSSSNARIPKAHDIAARATAAQDSEDLRRTIANRSLKRKAESQLPNEQPSQKLTKTNQDSEDPHPPQHATPSKKRQAPIKTPHTCCKCPDHLRLELARAAQAFQDQEEQIHHLNTEAESYERLLAQEDDYIQRLLWRLENSRRPVLCTAEDDMLEVLSKANEVLRERDLEWRREVAARAMFEIVRPVEVALRGECEELRWRLREAEGRVKVLQQLKGVPWVPLPEGDGD